MVSSLMCLTASAATSTRFRQPIKMAGETVEDLAYIA